MEILEGWGVGKGTFPPKRFPSPQNRLSFAVPMCPTILVAHGNAFHSSVLNKTKNRSSIVVPKLIWSFIPNLTLKEPICPIKRQW
jgi:hypothetical protein